MLSQALAEQPCECCGLLAGVIEKGAGRVVARYPLANALASPQAYRAEERALLQAHKDMRARGLNLLAIYHSHPTSAPLPSATDQREWYYGPEVVCLIISLTTTPATVRGWWLTENAQHEIDWEIVESAERDEPGVPRQGDPGQGDPEQGGQRRSP